MTWYILGDPLLTLGPGVASVRCAAEAAGGSVSRGHHPAASADIAQPTK